MLLISINVIFPMWCMSFCLFSTSNSISEIISEWHIYIPFSLDIHTFSQDLFSMYADENLVHNKWLRMKFNENRNTCKLEIFEFTELIYTLLTNLCQIYKTGEKHLLGWDYFKIMYVYPSLRILELCSWR